MFRKFIVLIALGVACGAAAQAKELPDFTELVEKQGASVVNISTTQIIRTEQGFPNIPENDPFYDFFRRYAPQMPHGQAPREHES
ncbi:MAG: protease Do, partial [Gallionella sp.]|nr:protease Do [Gallionella sp.]